MVRVKARKLYEGERVRKYRPRKIGSIIRFVSRRLKGPPLTHTGRLKREYRDLADQIAQKLMDDARKGKYEAIRLLVECSEGDFIRQRVLNTYVYRIYTVIEKYVTDEETLFQIGRELNLLKHRIGQGCNYKYPNPNANYKHPESLDPNSHEDPKFRNLLDRPSTILGGSS